jgi:hypothetical protein
VTLRDESNSRYLVFERIDRAERKTPIIRVLSRSSGIALGTIAWYGAWRQFCFYPEPRTIFNVGCMADISEAIAALKAERVEL